MKSFLAIIFCTLMATTFAAHSTGFFPHPDYPEKCVISDTLIMSAGERIQDPYVKCGEIWCSGDEDGKAEFISCGLHDAISICQVQEGDSSLNYPECCPTIYDCVGI